MCSLVKEKTYEMLFRKTDLQPTVMRMLELDRREVISEPWRKTGE
jgi:hypothetical protein